MLIKKYKNIHWEKKYEIFDFLVRVHNLRELIIVGTR